MSSDKKLETNRRNALKSTGPRSRRGKNLSRFNAVKSGIHALAHLLPGEDAAAYRRLIRETRDCLGSQGPIETVLADQIISDIWRIKRLERAEATFFENLHENLQVKMFRSLSTQERELYQRICDAPSPRPSDCQAVEGNDSSPVEADNAVEALLRELGPDAEMLLGLLRKIRRAEDPNTALLQGVVPAEEKHPKGQIDRQRRAHLRDVLHNLSRLEALQTEHVSARAIPDETARSTDDDFPASSSMASQ